jgi:hypothetical protein
VRGLQACLGSISCSTQGEDQKRQKNGNKVLVKLRRDSSGGPATPVD